MVKSWWSQRIWKNGSNDGGLTVVQQEYLDIESLWSTGCQTQPAATVEMSFNPPDFFGLSIHSINLFAWCAWSFKMSLPSRSLLICAHWAELAFSHPSEWGTDVGNSSWSPHPWLHLPWPAGRRATWRPGWPASMPHLWVDALPHPASVSSCVALLVMLF